MNRLFKVKWNGYSIYVRNTKTDYILYKDDMFLMGHLIPNPNTNPYGITSIFLLKIWTGGIWQEVNQNYVEFYYHYHEDYSLNDPKVDMLVTIDQMADDITVSWNRENKLNELGI